MLRFTLYSTAHRPHWVHCPAYLKTAIAMLMGSARVPLIIYCLWTTGFFSFFASFSSFFFLPLWFILSFFDSFFHCFFLHTFELFSMFPSFSFLIHFLFFFIYSSFFTVFFFHFISFWNVNRLLVYLSSIRAANHLKNTLNTQNMHTHKTYTLRHTDTQTHRHTHRHTHKHTHRLLKNTWIIVIWYILSNFDRLKKIRYFYFVH